MDDAEPRAGAVDGTDAAARRRAVTVAGHRGDAVAAKAALSDVAASVRVAAVGALARSGALTADDLVAALVDPAPAVRRRACEAAADATIAADLIPTLADPEPTVAEACAWALGEREEATPEIVGALASAATTHKDALVREAAVAALGALGDPAGLPAVLAGTQDKPAVRRRAVIALAAFEGPDVDAALARALTDRDWQVRQAAEDLTSR